MPASYPENPAELKSYVSAAKLGNDLDLNSNSDPLQAPTLEDFYARSYCAVQDLQVSVDGDPIKRGLMSFHSKTSDLRRYQNLVVRLIFVGIRIRNKTHSNYLLAKEIFEQEVRALIVPMKDYEDAGNGKFVKLSADTKRQKAELQLEESRRKLQDLEAKYMEAKSFVEAMSLLKDNFKNTREDLSFSMYVLRSQMLTGEVSVNVNTNLSRKLEKELLEDRTSQKPGGYESIQEGEVAL